jgi:beta-galactosidase
VAIVQNGENVATEKRTNWCLPHIALRGIAIPLLCPKIQMEKNTIAFEGAMSEPLVYLKKVGEWAYGYSYFYFDVSQFIQEGDNTLAVKLSIKNLLHVGILVPVYIEM